MTVQTNPFSFSKTPSKNFQTTIHPAVKKTNPIASHLKPCWSRKKPRGNITTLCKKKQYIVL